MAIHLSRTRKPTSQLAGLRLGYDTLETIKRSGVPLIVRARRLATMGLAIEDLPGKRRMASLLPGRVSVGRQSMPKITLNPAFD